MRRGLLLHAFGLVVIAFLILPILIIVPMSFNAGNYLAFPPQGLSLRWYAAYFADPDWMAATWLSLRIALCVMLAATVIGTATAFALVRAGLSRHAGIQALIAAPMVAPAIITAVAFYLFLSRTGLLGTSAGFVLAHTVLALPVALFALLAQLDRIDPRLEMVALSLGASRPAAIGLITLRLAIPGILTAALFAFITSFDEATISYFVATADTKPLPKKMFEGIEWELTPIIAAVATLLILVSLAVVAALALRQHAQDRLMVNNRIEGEHHG